MKQQGGDLKRVIEETRAEYKKLPYWMKRLELDNSKVSGSKDSQMSGPITAKNFT